MEMVEASLTSVLGTVVEAAVLGVVVGKLAEDVRNVVALGGGVVLGDFMASEVFELVPVDSVLSFVALTFEQRTAERREKFISLVKVIFQDLWQN